MTNEPENTKAIGQRYDDDIVGHECGGVLVRPEAAVAATVKVDHHG